MVNIYDDDIERIEEMIVMKYNDYRIADADCSCLLELRKDMLNKRALEHQEELLPDFVAFNDALTNALKETYDRAHSIWDSIKAMKTDNDEVELTAKCFLGYRYPELHPVQGDNRQELWEALRDSEWNPIYESGVTFELRLPQDLNESFDYYTGMDCLPPNWNEGLDQELTKDLHLNRSFHNLFDHTNYALTDFIYVRRFETEIKIEINKVL